MSFRSDCLRVYMRSISSLKLINIDHKRTDITGHLIEDARPLILLLQGPVGPFFRDLQNYLDAAGLRIWRVCFNSGDRLFSHAKNQIHFKGNRIQWEWWLHQFLIQHQVDAVILFGCERVQHIVARQVCDVVKVPVLCLEEGYLRPGFISVELSGNNAASPLRCQDLVKWQEDWIVKSAPTKFCAFSQFFYAAIYYGICSFGRDNNRHEFLHREINIRSEILCWMHNLARYLIRRLVDPIIVARLIKDCKNDFFIIALQVSTDSQMKRGFGWTAERLIKASLGSFARFSSSTDRLVFKLHPLDRGHNPHRRLIQNTARKFGIEDRINIIETGSIDKITQYSTGMITINSTSGLYALKHNVPLLVLGDAIYANPRLAICAWGMPDFDRFWHQKNCLNTKIRTKFLNSLKQQCLKAGDFYNRKGRFQACHGILEKLRDQGIGSQKNMISQREVV